MTTGTNHLDDRHRIYEQRSLEVGEDFARYADWITTPMLPFIHGRVLEIGAGIGTIAERYVDRATTSVLLEPAENLHRVLAARMARRPRVETVCGFLDEVVAPGGEGDGRFAARSFDTVVMVNVLEHIADDGGTIALVEQLLGAHGRVVIFVPALPRLYGSYDDEVGHVRRYTKSGLWHLLASHGLRVDTLTYVDLLGIAPWFVSGRLLRSRQVSHGSAKLYDRTVVPLSRTVDRLVGPPIGKNLFAVAYAER